VVPVTTDRPVLELDEVHKYFNTERGIIDTILRREVNEIPAVDGVSVSLAENQTIGVIGESGCGKTTLLRCIAGLYDLTGGSIRYEGDDISEFDSRAERAYRRNVQIIFQDPFNSLNPKKTVRKTLLEPLRIHDVENREERVYDILRQVELNPPERFLDKYPRELSGGELQRISIGRALILEPDVILADEPVSMLDVSTQAAILKLLSRLTDEFDTSMLYISHDLSTVSYICDTINVMYLGRVIERAPTLELLDDPKHPYTQALINAIPVPDPHNERERTQLKTSPPDPGELRRGCRFKDRCPERMEVCDTKPEDVRVGEQWEVACHLYYDHEETTARGPRAGAETDGDQQMEHPVPQNTGSTTGAGPTAGSGSAAGDSGGGDRE
jgi:peptide/nickel transport system ATP-binding protein